LLKSEVDLGDAIAGKIANGGERALTSPMTMKRPSCGRRADGYVQ
jgi:hypothetical protein